MKRVIGIGGVFFKAKDPDKLRAWYQQHLGMVPDAYGSVTFTCPDSGSGEVAQTVWSLFPENTKYFNPATTPFMLNYRVADLHGLLKELRAEGVEVEEKTEEFDYGKFGWIMDPEGNRIELWEPAVPFEQEEGQ